MIDIKVTLDEALQFLADTIAKAQKPLVFMQLVAKQILADSRTAFDYEADPSTGAGWEPLSLTYLKRKERLFPGKGILVATNTMRRSMDVEAGFDEAGLGYARGFVRPSTGGRNRRSADEYASVHQFGSAALGFPEMNIPARPFMGLEPDSIDRLNELHGQWYLE
jgi:phage gpG-like protein